MKDTLTVLNEMVGKTISEIYKIDTGNDAYLQLYRVEFTDGSKVIFNSVDHHDADGFSAEWIIKN